MGIIKITVEIESYSPTEDKRWLFPCWIKRALEKYAPSTDFEIKKIKNLSTAAQAEHEATVAHEVLSVLDEILTVPHDEDSIRKIRSRYEGKAKGDAE